MDYVLKYVIIQISKPNFICGNPYLELFTYAHVIIKKDKCNDIPYTNILFINVDLACHLHQMA